MIGYTLKHVLELIPEALPMVKSASIEADYPLDSRDNCLASALVISYKKNFTTDVVDYDVLTKVAQAVELFDLGSTIQTLESKMTSRTRGALVKQASVSEEGTFLTKQAAWEGDLSGMYINAREMAQRAEVLMEKAAAEGLSVSAEVQMYAGFGALKKEALEASLSTRYGVTQDPTFVKLASALGSETADFITNPRTVKSLCNVVNRLDESHGLFEQGFNIYKEAMVSKSAAASRTSVEIGGRTYPIERILGIPATYLNHYLGPDFRKELENDPGSAKYIIESLPNDTKQLLATVLTSI